MQRRRRDARVERGDACRDRRQRGLRLAAALVEPDAEPDEPGGGGKRELHPRVLADPTVPHGHHDEEDRGDRHGDAADPAEDAAA